MGCSCTSNSSNRREITEVAEEPLLAVYEDDAPHVYGCGAGGCDPRTGGSPRAIRVERFSGTGTIAAATIELSPSLQEAYARPIPACLPWVRVTRDPANFSKCLQAARALGPIDTGKKVYELFKAQAFGEDQEVFYVLLLDTQLKCRGVSEISRGARDSVQTPIPDLLRLPIIEGAMAFVIVHTHPSGKVTPSQADKDVTKSILEAGEAVGVPLMDHVIIGADSYYSFYEHNLIK